MIRIKNAVLSFGLRLCECEIVLDFKRVIFYFWYSSLLMVIHLLDKIGFTVFCICFFPFWWQWTEAIIFVGLLL